LIALEGLLVGDINNISRSDVVEEVLLAPQGFLLLLFLKHSFNVMFITAWLVERRDEFRIDDTGIIPLGLTRLAMFIIQLLPGNPLLIVGSLIEDRPLGGVPDDYALGELQG
jgi:hypothetical protein